MKLLGCKMGVGKEQREQTKQRNKAFRIQKGGWQGTKKTKKTKKWSFEGVKWRLVVHIGNKQSKQIKF
jgi:hypothetical protein